MTTKHFKKTYEDHEAAAQQIMAEKDAELAKVRDKYTSKLQKANQDAADAQKVWMDAVAAEALLDRPDGEAVAAALGLELPTK